MDLSIDGGCVVFIQQEGPPGDDFAPASHGWELLGTIEAESGDVRVGKQLNDAFHDTCLGAQLQQVGADRLLVAGWATDLCVDATVRSGVALGYEVVVVSDCHTVSDRPHLSAAAIIGHHHWVWANLLAPKPVTVARAAELSPS